MLSGNAISPMTGQDHISQMKVPSARSYGNINSQAHLMTSLLDRAGAAVQVEDTRAHWKDERERLQAGQAEARLQASQRLTDLTEQYNRCSLRSSDGSAWK